MSDETTSEPRRSARNAGKPQPPPVVKRPAGKRAAPADKKEDAASKKAKAEDEPTEANGEPATAVDAAEPSKEVDEPAKAGDEPVKDDAEPAAAPEETEAAEKPASKGSKKLELGDVLPAITLKNERDEDVDVSKLVGYRAPVWFCPEAGEKGVVFFLYPKAATPGCTTQACLYRDAKQAFGEQGYDIYGLSKDKPAAQAKWIESKSLSYSLLSDPSSELIKALGAFAAPASTKRSHFIFEKGTGKLIDAAIGVKPADDSSKALDFIKQHHA